MKVADLFCGVGGLSQGFVWAGCKIALGIEHDPEIALSYKKNHPDTDVYVNDIRNLDFKEIHQKHPIIDIVIGGPSCQGFSQKGKRLNLEDPRNFLFQSFVDFVAEFSPKYFVLENVPEIITTSGGFFCNEIISAFKQIGYSVRYGVLNAADFGVPQDRRRAVFIGKRGDQYIELPRPCGQRSTIKDAIYDLPFIESGCGSEISGYETPATSPLQQFLRADSTILYNHVATRHSKIALERLALIPIGGGREALPPEHRTKSIYSGTWCRLLENGLASTITTRFDTPSSGRFTHPVLNRCLTVREAARIQTFPDSFRFYGSKTCQMKQVGNAVPPLLSLAIATQITNNENL